MPPRIPKPVRSVNVFGLPLNTLEGFVLSLVDGAVSVEDISIMSGIDQNKLTGILERLGELGAVELSWVEKQKPSTKIGFATRGAAPATAPDAHFATDRPRYAAAALD